MLREGCDSISFHNFALLEMEHSYKWRIVILGTGPYLSRVGGGGGRGLQDFSCVNMKFS